MKTLFLSIAALCSLTAFGQEKTYSFDKKVSYKITIQNEFSSYFDNEDVFLNTYLAKDALLGNFEGEITSWINSTPFQQASFFIQNNRVFDVISHSLENRLSINVPSLYQEIDFESLQPYNDSFIGDFVSVQKLNTTQKVNGYTCNNFEIITKNSEDQNNTATICIDEKNSLNNASYLFPQANLKGLLIKLEDQDSTGFTIDKVSTSTAKISFDEKKEIENFKTKVAKQIEQYKELYGDTTEAVDSAIAAINGGQDNRYEDPMVNYYNYQTSENDKVNNLFGVIASLNYSLVYNDIDYDGNPDIERSVALKTAQGSTKAIIKEYKKNNLLTKSEAKELEGLFNKLHQEAKDFKLVQQESFYEPIGYAPEETVDSISYDYDAYQSTYKTDDISQVSLAVELNYLQDYLKTAPEYCTDLKSKIPVFADKDLGNLVYNYTGQVCDLYIYNSGNVALTETINALRKSVLEINNKYEKLKKEDKDKLTTFLNSLD